MNIFFSADDAYAQHLAVAIRSLVRQATSSMDIFILDDGISPQNKEKIFRTDPHRQHSIAFHEVDNKLRMGGNAVAHVSKTALLRLFLPKLFPSISKGIFLDADIVALSSLQPLWQADLSAAPLAMVEDPWGQIPSHKLALGLTSDEAYFNAGMMVMNFDYLRQGGFIERLFAFLRKYNDTLRFADQDVLNCVMRGKIRPLHPRWNVMTAMRDWVPEYTLTYGSAEAEEAMRRPAIAHFTGGPKPWHPGCRHLFRAQYFAVLAETAFAEPHQLRSRQLQARNITAG